MRILFWLAAAGCQGDDEPVDETDAPVTEDTSPPNLPFDCATSTLTWENWAGPFFTTWCTPCHSATVTGDMRKGAPERSNFDSYAEVAFFLPAIALVVPQTNPDPLAYPPRMPPGGGVPDATKLMLAEWITCGAAEGDPPPIEACTEITVVPGDLVLDSQASIDAFCAAGNAVGGDLTITAPEAVTVECLCEVQGDLSVGVGTTTDIDLPELRTLGGSLSITETVALGTFSANSLAAVPGGILVAGTSNLREVFLYAVDTVGASVQLLENDDLAIAELPELDSVTDDVVINGNSSLLVLNLMRVRDVRGDVTLKFNDVLTDVTAFDSIETIGGTLRIDHNRDLKRLSWFQALQSVGGSLQIIDNFKLEDVFGFWLLDQVGEELLVSGNTVLTSVLGLELLTSATTITVADNPLLTQVGFPALAQVDFFTLRNNDGLLEIDGPPLLADAGLLTLEDNDALTFVNGFAAVTTTDGVVISGNDALVGFAGYPLVTVVEGGLVFLDAPQLVSIGVWSSATEIHGTLRLENLDALASSSGLEGVTVVEGDLLVVGNATLADLDGQAALDIVGGDLSVIDNPLLPQAEIDSVVEALSVMGGTVTISGNGG